MLSFGERSLNNQFRILIVDDNEAIHDDFRKILNPSHQEITNKINQIYTNLFEDKANSDRDFATMPEFIIDSAYQGIQSLELVQKALSESKPYALAFVDVRMPPGWDGIETIKHLWEKDEDIQIVLCTAFSDYSWPEMIKHLGQTDKLLILKKPFDVVEIKQISCALTSKWELQRRATQELTELKKSNAETTLELEKTISINKSTLTQLIQSSRMASIGQLAAGVAHEINNPISFILSSNMVLKDYLATIKKVFQEYDAFLETIKPTHDNDIYAAKLKIEESIQAYKINSVLQDCENVLTESLEGLDRVKNIVAGLKSYLHENHKLSIDIDINACIDSTIKIIPPVLKQKMILQKNYGELPKLTGHQMQISQVFLNLLVNAAQAIKEKGTITIDTNFINNEIVIKISDTGAGISPENISKIFDPFFTTREIGEGTGLGLSISSTIVNSHSGRLTVESTVGKGTTFTVYFPLNAIKKEIMTS